MVKGSPDYVLSRPYVMIEKKRKHIAFSFCLIYELEFCYRTSFPEFIFPAQITELIII
jgi:hypothetical protein